jgi:hypothetical protein
MSEKDRQIFIDILHKEKKRLAKSKAASKKFLVNAGIITPKGKLKQAYRHLCIPQDQD